jgi:predicted dehydrogenase
MAIPHPLRAATAAGIGLLLTFIGLQNAGLVAANPATMVGVGTLDHRALLTCAALVVSVWLARRNNPFAYLAGIALVTVAAWAAGYVAAPPAWFSAPDFSSVFFKLDVLGALQLALVPAIITVMMTDLFDSLSTFIGVAHAASLVDERGEPKNLRQGLIVDAFATFGAGLFGSSAGTAYVESIAGIRMGGRTGLTAVVTALCFLPCLFIAPIAAAIPNYATSAVLILVGVAMFQPVTRVEFDRLEVAVPAFATLILIPLTFSITQGILWGFILHAVLHTVAGRTREVSAARRQVDRAVVGRAVARHAGSRGQQHRRPDAAHGRQHALAVDRLPDQRRREAEPDAGSRIRRPAAVARRAAGRVGARLDVPVRRAGAAHRRRPRAHGDDSQRAALGVQGDQPPDGALRGARLPDPAARQAPVGAALEDAVDPARPERGIQPKDAGEVEVASQLLTADCRLMTVRWGILGTARINRRLVPAFGASRRGELCAVASRDQARAEAQAREYGIPRAVQGYRALLDDPAIDAVYIPLPNTEHVPWTLAAIAAGKHVLCEKPLVLDPRDVDRIAAAATAAGVVVEEGFMYRHEPLTAAVVKLLNDGAIGAIRAIVSGFTFALEGSTPSTSPGADANIRLNPALGGGALWDVGSYPVSYAQLVAGHEPTMVYGAAHWHASGVDEEFMGMLRFDGGLSASVFAGFRTPYRTWLEILGTDGTLTVPNPFRPEPVEVLELERNSGIQHLEVRGSSLLFLNEIEDFEARILDGAPAVVTLAESRRTAATLAALHAAARETEHTGLRA